MASEIRDGRAGPGNNEMDNGITNGIASAQSVFDRNNEKNNGEGIDESMDHIGKNIDVAINNSNHNYGEGTNVGIDKSTGGGHGHTENGKHENKESIMSQETGPDVTVPESIDSLGPPPDGGLTAWMQVVAAFFANFNSWGVVNAFGVFQEFYQANLLRHDSPGRISWIASLSGSLLLGSTLLWGYPLDAGYMKIMGLLGACLQFVSLMLLGSLCRNYWSIMLTQGLFTGLVSGMLFIISIGTVAPYFSKKRPLAIGIGASGSSVGGTIYSVMARKLLQTLGFAWAVRIIAFVQLATCLVMFLCLRRRLPPRLRKDFFAYECFKELPFMLYCMGNLTGFCGLYIFFVHFESYGESLKPNYQPYLYITAILNAGSALGRIGPGYLASLYGPFNVLVPAMLLSAVLAFCWIPAKSAGGVISIAFLLGLISGPLIGLPGAVVAHLTSNLNRLGIRLSFALLYGGIGIVLGPPFAGILQRSYGWLWVKLYCALCFILSAIFMLAARQVLAKGRVVAIV